MKNEVRIIGGKWKGRKLRFPDHPGLRPSLGRAREALFNWLVVDVVGARCLDLFAGSGALGFEAESRGAREVVLIESDRRVAAALKGSAKELGATARVLQRDAHRYLKSSTHTADIVFLDPPFAEPELAITAVQSIAERGLLAPDGCIYLELAAKGPIARPRIGETLHGLTWRKASMAGDTVFGLLGHPDTDTIPRSLLGD